MDMVYIILHNFIFHFLNNAQLTYHQMYKTLTKTRYLLLNIFSTN